MWYEDLTVHDFCGRGVLRVAIGWLHFKKPFTTGEISQNVYEKLCELKEMPWLDYVAMGWHECEFCEKAEYSYPYPETYCSRNLTIPHNGKLYHYPDLITHYIKKHSYQPPEEFCEAVLSCPPMDSMEYYNKMVENGGQRLLSFFEEFWTDERKLEK